MSKPQTREQWQARADALHIRHQAFIDGRYVDAASGKTFDCISPADGRAIIAVAECEAEDVNRAVAAGSFNVTFWSTGGTAVDAPVVD